MSRRDPFKKKSRDNGLGGTAGGGNMTDSSEEEGEEPPSGEASARAEREIIKEDMAEVLREM